MVPHMVTVIPILPSLSSVMRLSSHSLYFFILHKISFRVVCPVVMCHNKLILMALKHTMLFRLYILLIPYILKSNPHPFYSFRWLKNQMRITVVCGLYSRSRAGFWKNDAAAVSAIRTMQYNNILFYLSLIIIYYSSDSPSSLITESLSVLRRDCTRLLRKTCFTILV
jgi:hypothetical protein